MIEEYFLGGKSVKYQTMIGILFTLLARRKVSAGELAAKFDISVRTVYRYVDEVILANIPINVSRGANGGIYISDAFKLPRGFLTREEYTHAIGALDILFGQTGDPVYRDAATKLSAEMKSERLDNMLAGNILVDCGTWGDERKFSDKLTLLENAIEAREALSIEYVARGGERTQREILPHLLVYKENLWYVYAFCRKRAAFRLFKVGRIRTMLSTGETFERLPFDRDDIPLCFWRTQETVDAKFEIEPSALPLAEEWLGIENIASRDGTFIAEVSLPDDETLVKTILSVGTGLKVLAPEQLKTRVVAAAKAIAENNS